MENAPRPHDRARVTYTYLRLIVAIPATWLLVGIVCVSIYRRGPFDSISDYYSGPFRDVFVGSLFACGVLMVAYKGQSRLEDYALNFAGVNAVFVALVPNSYPQLLAETVAAEQTDNPPVVGSDELLGILRLSMVLFLLIATAFAWYDYQKISKAGRHDVEMSSRGRRVIKVVAVLEIAVLLAVVWMLFAENVGDVSIFTIVHFGSAATLVVNLSVAAASNAFASLHEEGRGPMDRWRDADFESSEALAQFRRKHVRAFKWITFLMWAGILIGGPCIALQVPYAVLVTEYWELVLFVVFWLRSTGLEQRLPDVRLLDS